MLPIILSYRGLSRREDRSRLGERFGQTDLARPQKRLYWLHSTSVGESVSSYVLARAIVSEDEDSSVLMTSGTMTSAEMLKKKIIEDNLAQRIIHQFQPLDHPGYIRRFLDHWQPDILAVVENNIWPLTITMTAEREIPVIMVSANISERAVRRWRWAGPVARQRIFSSVRKILTTDSIEAARFKTLTQESGIPIEVGGALKTAATTSHADNDMARRVKAAAAGRPITLFASTHEDEEEMLSDTVRRLPGPDKRLVIIAPRHSERGPAMQARIPAPRLAKGEWPQQRDGFWIADTMGMMSTLYHVADIIVLCGGFTAHGGHNPMEAAAQAKSVISGRDITRNRVAFGKLEELGGVIWADNSLEITQAINLLEQSLESRDIYNAAALKAYQSFTRQADKAAAEVIALAAERS